MSYLTRQSLRDATSNLELAQVASPRDQLPLDADTIGSAIDGVDYSGDPQKAAIDYALAKIDQAITDAQGIVDSYIAARYAPVPLSAPPAVVVAVTIVIARYALANVRTAQETRTRYQDAIAWLTQVASGVVTLVVPGAVATVQDLPDVDDGSGLYSVNGLAGYAAPFGSSPTSA